MLKPNHMLFMIDKELLFLNAYEKSILKIVVRMPEGCRYPAKEIASQIGSCKKTVLRSVANLEYAGLVKVERTKTNRWTLGVGDGWKFAIKNGLNYANLTRSEMIPERKKSVKNSPLPGDQESSPWRPTVPRGGDPESSLKGVRKENERLVITREISDVWELLSPSPTNRFFNGSQKSQLQVNSLVENFVVFDVFPSRGVA